jgi:hypothetical protein
MTQLNGLSRSAEETTPLLGERQTAEEKRWDSYIIHRLLFCGFLVALSFGVTQVP